MRVIFLGTPAFAAIVLKAVIASKHEVVAVVTQPDRANARGKKVVISPVKATALEFGLPVYQFEKISRDGVEVLRVLQADIMVTAAYGQILSREILCLCPHGVINAHGSILPKYRGASPVQCALLEGETETGVSVMKTEYEVDSGDVILEKRVRLQGHENCDEVMEMLAEAGAEGIVEALDLIEDGKAVFTKQNHEEATFCKKINKEDGKIDFSMRAGEIVNRIRAFTPWPSAYTESPFGRLKILRAKAVEGDFEGVAGEIVDSNKHGITIKCGSGAIFPTEVQAEGCRAMDIATFLRGHAMPKGTVLK